MSELVDNVALAFKTCNQQRERIAELERQLVASRASAMEEAAAIVENGSAFSEYTQVASIHAKWIRDAIRPHRRPNNE